jgi:hypothetical protein
MMEEIQKKFPLPILWRTQIDWFFSSRHAPCLDGNSLVMRCGEQAVWFLSSNGDILKTTLLAERAGDGTFFYPYQKTYLTDVVRRPERLSSIVAITSGGIHTWRVDLPIIIVPGGSCLAGDTLYVLGMEPGVGSVIYLIEASSGSIMRQAMLKWGASAVIAVKDELLIGNQLAGDHGPGLYRTDKQFNEFTVVDKGSVWSLLRRGDLILTVSRSSSSETRLLQIRDAASLEVLWTTQTQNEAIAFLNNEIYHVELGSGFGALVARQVQTGQRLWQSESLAYDIRQIEGGGPVLFCAHMTGAVLYRRRDGYRIGEITGRYGPPTVDGDRLYIGGAQAVLCVSTEGIY